MGACWRGSLCWDLRREQGGIGDLSVLRSSLASPGEGGVGCRQNTGQGEGLRGELRPLPLWGRPLGATGGS